MSATRTQVYLTQSHRDRIDAVVRSEGVTLAEVVRRALDAYLDDDVAAGSALADTFGADPGVTSPDRDDWARG